MDKLLSLLNNSGHEELDISQQRLDQHFMYRVTLNQWPWICMAMQTSAGLSMVSYWFIYIIGEYV